MVARHSRHLKSAEQNSSDDAGAWLTLLTSKLTADWRPGEWSPSTLIFTGDPDNPQTVVYRCKDDSCSMTTSTRDQYCHPCLHRRATGRTSQRVAQHWLDDEPKCGVSNTKGQCQRPTASGGFCRSHYAQMRSWAVKGHSIEEFMTNATPHPSPGVCGVELCSAQISFVTTDLCGHHQRSWQRRQESESDLTLDRFKSSEPELLRHNQFSLRLVTPAVAAEILYVLQQRDAKGFGISPPRVRRLTQIAKDYESLLDIPPIEADDLGKTQRSFNTVLGTLKYQLEERDPLDGNRWGPAELASLPTRGRAQTHRTLVCDWTKVECEWLRELGKSWTRMTQPYREDINDVILALRHASDALSGRPAFRDPAKADYSDAKCIHQHIYKLRSKRGTTYHTSTAGARLTSIRSVLSVLRETGQMNHVPTSFTFTGMKAPQRTVLAEDEIGKSLPLDVIDLLEENLDTLTTSMSSGFLPVGWTNDDYGWMLRTIFIVLRDTGRRPTEVCALSRDCLRSDVDGDPILVYDNSKSGKLGVRLAIGARAADAIEVWKAHIDQVAPAPPTSYLFPAIQRRLIVTDQPHSKKGFTTKFGLWVRQIADLPDLLAEYETRNIVIKMGDVIPYSLRHSYAQEHADAGVDVETLQELMGHEDPKTTQGYYRISSKRKRAAITQGQRYRVDRRGRLQPVPHSADEVYARRSVPTVLGHCTERENVAEGGTACKIRFQCAGCGHWEPDPSFLPEIREEVVRLKAAAHEVQESGSAAPQVIDNLLYNAAQLESAGRYMESEIAQMPPDERAAFDRWITNITSARRNHRLAVSPTVTLPLTVVTATPHEEAE